MLQEFHPAVVAFFDLDRTLIGKSSGELKNYFYTDSIRDLPALEAVGYPRPVNPDGALVRVARSRGWPVERFFETLGNV